LLPTLGGEACAIAFVEKHIADRTIKNLTIIPIRLSARARQTASLGSSPPKRYTKNISPRLGAWLGSIELFRNLREAGA
jgi:hypothetical protein